MLQRLSLALILLLAMDSAGATQPLDFDPGLSGFTLQVKGLDIPYREFAVFAMPGEAVAIATVDPSANLQLRAGGGELRATGTGQWTWIAPGTPGDYPIDIVRDDGASMRLEAFVMVPATGVHNGKLNGYRIGRYPQHPLDGLSIYKPPLGFVEVTQADENVHVSPHFTLGQFLCKQASSYPKYVVLRGALLLKLEAAVAYLQSKAIPASAIHVMSGYRTPYYNAWLGNVLYSRHQWGDAADIYIDIAEAVTPESQAAMRIFRDSRRLATDLDRLFHEPAYAYLTGGLGVYPATHTHPPFVHVDSRGFRASW